MLKPEIRYARNGEIAIGYCVLGDGPADLAYLSPFNNLDIMWESPLYAAFLRSLATFARVIVIDRRGTGVSDRYSPDDLPLLEDLVDDLAAVLDAVGSDRATLFGFSDAGALCAMFASTRPDRVAALVLHATAARGTQVAEYPWQWSEEQWRDYLREVRNGWGTREYAKETLALFNPSLAGDRQMERWWERYQRLSASPSAIYAQEKVFREMDIRHLLPAISVPALVLHRTDDQIEPVGAGRYIADQIAGAEFVELGGADHFPWAGDQEALVAEVRQFIDQVQREHEEEFDRVLATVLFTDVVDSTARSAEMGDRRWREVRSQHDNLIRAQLARYRGREVDTAGDGFFAVFDGPARAARCGSRIAASMAQLGLEVRVGLHTGEVRYEGDAVTGIAVAIGARIGSLAEPGEVLASSTVKDLVVGSELTFVDRGTHALKGVPDDWRVFAVAA